MSARRTLGRVVLALPFVVMFIACWIDEGLLTAIAVMLAVVGVGACTVVGAWLLDGAR